MSAVPISPQPAAQRLPAPRATFWLVAAASAWLCVALPVFSQETYYWTYAQHPDLSYFDHPPMVAWMIWLGTAVFGDGVMGVRFGTWLCGLGTTWFGARLLREFGVGRGGQSLWMVLSLASPILAMTHFLANPDPPLVCCWTLAMWALWRARDGELRWWLLAGVAAGAALLSKYSAAFLGLGGVVVLLVDAKMRRQLLRPAPWLAVLVAALVFAPVVIWNVQHDFESFRFQTEGRFERGSLGVHWLLGFVGEQAAVVHPLLAVAIAAAVAWLAQRARPDVRARWLLAFGLPLPFYMLVNSLWIQVKINWLAPAMVPLLFGVVLWWTEHLAARASPRLVRIAVVLLAAVPLAVPLAPALRLVPVGAGTSWIGWDEIAARAEVWEDIVDPQDGIEGNCFFFAADYRDASQLQRSMLLERRKDPHEHPITTSIDFEPTMAQNVIGMRALQYDHWSQPSDRIGQDAIFVLARPQHRERMVYEAERRFATVQRVERVQVHRLGIHVFDADIYVCRGYKGPHCD